MRPHRLPLLALVLGTLMLPGAASAGDPGADSRAARAKERHRAWIIRHRMKRIDTGQYTPKAAKRLFELFMTAKGLRAQALRAKPDFDRLARKRKSLVAELRKREEERRSIREKFPPGSTHPPKVARRANRRLASCEKAHGKILARIRKLDDELDEIAGRMPDYLEAYRTLKTHIDEKEGDLNALGENQQDRAFYRTLAAEIGEMDSDFSKSSVPGRGSGSMLAVTAVLNGSVSASLIVDTGASLVSLSPGIVEKLSLGPGEMAGTVSVQVADGRTIRGESFYLDSISVGDKEARRVLAAAIPSKLSGYDGLLGMSFLKNFIVEIDPKSNRLLLKSLK
ncbi:MAG: retropepsin-like aspartic protease [Elusimicrobiota bacterium]